MSRELLRVGDLAVEEADPASDLERLAAGICGFDNAMQQERLPGDAALPVDITLTFLANIPSFLVVRRFLARDTEGRIAAAATVTVERTESNQHLCSVEIGVKPEHRRQGVAKALLELALQAAEEEGRTLLLGSVAEPVPAGEAFARRIGARCGLRKQTYSLRMSNANRRLARRWQQEGESKAGLRLVRIDGRYPDDRIDGIIRLQHVVNAEPRGELEIEDQILSSTRAREVEAIWLGAQGERWGFFVQEAVHGQLVGWTEVVWYPSLPKTAFSIGTGVLAEFRGRGVAKWLRAALVEWLVMEKPEIEEIRMDIADSNEGMRSVSERLGFEPRIGWTLWQVPARSVREYLAS